MIVIIFDNVVNVIQEIFLWEKVLIGMIYCLVFLGVLCFWGISNDVIYDVCMWDVEIFILEGFYGLIVENYGDVLFFKFEDIGLEIVVFMLVVVD